MWQNYFAKTNQKYIYYNILYQVKTVLFEKYSHLICINIIFLLEFEILLMKVEWQSTGDYPTYCNGSRVKNLIFFFELCNDKNTRTYEKTNFFCDK